MVRQPAGMTLQPQDYQLFEYLHAVKAATYDQVARDVYPTHKLESVGNRIRKIEDQRLIDISISRRALGGKRYLSLSKKAFDEYVRTGTEMRIELKSDAIRHDLRLVDIRHHLMRSPRLIEYLTENQIQTWGHEHRYVNSDALLRLKYKADPFYVALEYECSVKKGDRYDAFARRYYSLNLYTIVFIVSETQAALKQIMKAEAKIYQGKLPKFFYRLASDLLSDDAMIFYNVNNYSISLGV